MGKRREDNPKRKHLYKLEWLYVPPITVSMEEAFVTRLVTRLKYGLRL
jgi:hypothetical protein